MKIPTRRRQFLQWLSAATGLAVLPRAGDAQLIDRELLGEPEHKLVYQFNKAEADYMDHILFSVGAMLREHGDNIHIVVTAFGPGIHILGKIPGRPISEGVRKRVESLAAYGVSFHACGNTMKTLNWTGADMLEFVEVVDVGANDLMLLQEQGYSYISW
jgi:intracellular sulfur oxidation DsrE/DsrF family protein